MLRNRKKEDSFPFINRPRVEKTTESYAWEGLNIGHVSGRGIDVSANGSLPPDLEIIYGGINITALKLMSYESDENNDGTWLDYIAGGEKDEYGNFIRYVDAHPRHYKGKYANAWPGASINEPGRPNRKEPTPSKSMAESCMTELSSA
jgi:hypothetical protein